MGRTNKRAVDGNSVTFQYPEVVHNHYKYRDSVDSHNSRRMHPVAIEEQCKTSRWAYRVFQFLVTVTEVNCNLTNHHHFEVELADSIAFRYSLADQLINNPYVVRTNQETRKRKVSVVANQHDLVCIPAYHTFHGSTLVSCLTRYIQRKCSSCPATKIRYCCTCSPGTIRCKDCFKTYLLEKNG